MTDATTTIVLQALTGDHPMVLSALQRFLAAHLPLFERFWWAIFLLTGAAMLVVLVRSARED